MKDSSRREELTQPLPRPEVLGTIPHDSKLLSPEPVRPSVTWTNSEGVTFEITEPPAPWEVGEPGQSPSDARRFVECPPQWKLRWVNPRLLESEGWRDWQPVMASDPRVKVKVSSMVSPENYIRRGGIGGDILCWMWEGWYKSRAQQLIVRTMQQTESAFNKPEVLKEEFKRGTFKGVRLEEANHPTHTLLDGKSLKSETD